MFVSEAATLEPGLSSIRLVYRSLLHPGPNHMLFLRFRSRPPMRSKVDQVGSNVGQQNGVCQVKY